MLLENKNAIICGGGGSIGGAVAREFSKDGAHVFLAGRTREPLEAVAGDIEANGGRADVSVLDALDEAAVDEHARTVAEKAGTIDITLATAAFLASEKAGAITGTFVNVTSGTLPS